MENFKLNQIGNISSKIIKLMALIVGLSFAEKTFSQETMKDLITQTKSYELKISERVAKEGDFSFINQQPTARITTESGIIEVTYTDEERKNPSSFLVLEKGVYYWDIDNDGAIDRVYLDKKISTKIIPTEEDFNQIKITMANPTETEVKLSDITGKEYTLFDLNNYFIYDTNDLSIYKIPNDLKQKVQDNFQVKFNEVLESEVNN